MIRITLAQMRRSLGRLAAAGLAIAIGAAFVTATLLAGNVITRTTYDAVSSEYADADLVVTATEDFDAAALATMAAMPGVGAVQGLTYTGAQLSGPSGGLWIPTTARAGDPRLEPAAVLAGRLPDRPGEIALPSSVAEQLGVDVDGTVVSSRPSTDGSDAEVTADLRVTGLLDTPSAFLSTSGSAVLDAAQAEEWLTADYGGQPSWYQAMIALDPGADQGASVMALEKALGTTADVQTHDEHAAEQVAQLTGSTTLLVAVVLAFAAVSLLVATLVIANTFQVLVAQRTRTLALLRCVGADRRQLRRGVLLEATILGVVSSAAGVLLGIGLVQAALTILGRATDVPLPSTVSVSLAAVLVPLAVGTAVTLLASLSPARAATRVSPLGALRPEVIAEGGRSSRGRAWIAGLLVVGGTGLLVLGIVMAGRDSMELGLAVGMLGGAVSFFGVLLGSVFWVPSLLGRTGRFLGRGIAGRLAAANSVRNPRRVATTSGALFIGVTLVAMMATGAASATRAFTAGLSEYYPVDIGVSAVGGGAVPEPLLGSFSESVAHVDGVSDVTTLIGSYDITIEGSGDVTTRRALGADPDAAAAVMLDPAGLTGLDDGTILIPRWETTDSGSGDLAPGTVVNVSGPGGEVPLTVVPTDLSDTLVTIRTLRALDPSARDTELWVHVDDAGDAAGAVADIQKLADDSGQVLQVVGAAVERAFFQRVVDTLLAVVVGLLGVAVVIAVVGVANTLSLSVLERRRESATLRAIGLTRAQLRGTLAIEGLLVAGVGTVVGAVLGVLYGWAGAHILLAEVSDVGLAVPWRDLGLVMVVALAAGALASVLPARSAARTPPVEALAAE